VYIDVGGYGQLTHSPEQIKFNLPEAVDPEQYHIASFFFAK
jgi:hypothetical protein